MFQYRQVLVHMRQGDSDRDIARARLMGRKKAAQLRALAELRGWLITGSALPEDAELAAVFKQATRARTCVSSLEAHRQQVADWSAAGTSGVAIHAALVRQHGYTGSYSAVRRMLQSIDAARPPQATMILTFAPGEAAQVDFGTGPVITDAVTGVTCKTWVFVMTLCYSRHQYAEIVRDQTVATWLGCHQRAFAWFNGVVARVIIDNPKCAITRACTHDPEVQRAYAECAEGYGFKIDPCPPRDPAKKGIVEAGVKYVKRNFLPLREFRSLGDANAQLRQWVIEQAGNRVHGSTRERPLTRFAGVEQPLLKPLPDVPPELAEWAKLTVHRDSHVQWHQCLYSVPYRLVGRDDVWLRGTDTSVRAYHEHTLVATHPRLREPGKRSTVRDHLPPDAIAWTLADPQWCLREAERLGPAVHAFVRTLFADRVLERLRAAQATLRLAKRYGAVRLDAACQRALTFGNARYRTVKTILAKGLDQQDAQAAFDATADIYAQGGRFLRGPAADLIH
jgi:transposase